MIVPEIQWLQSGCRLVLKYERKMLLKQQQYVEVKYCKYHAPRPPHTVKITCEYIWYHYFEWVPNMVLKSTSKSSYTQRGLQKKLITVVLDFAEAVNVI
jgi:hypothetical protein